MGCNLFARVSQSRHLLHWMHASISWALNFQHSPVLWPWAILLLPCSKIVISTSLHPAHFYFTQNWRPECCSVCVKGSLGTIVAGDLNCAPDSLEMHMFRALLPQLHDCWQQVLPHQPGFTSNAVDNSFTKQGQPRHKCNFYCSCASQC